MHYCFIYLLFRTKQVLPLLLDIYSETLLDRSFQTSWKFVDGSSAKSLDTNFNVFHATYLRRRADNDSRARLPSYGFQRTPVVTPAESNQNPVIVLLTLIHWIAIYPAVDSVIKPSSNRGQSHHNTGGFRLWLTDLRETLCYIESQQSHSEVGLPVIVTNNSKHSISFGVVSERFLQVSYLPFPFPELMKLKLAGIALKRPQNST